MGNGHSTPTALPVRRVYERGGVRPLIFAGAVVIAVILTDLIDLGADHSRIRLLDANVDTSWSHRATAAALAAGAAVSLLRALRSGTQRAWWSATAAILILLFLVEDSPIHVQVDRLSYGKLIYAPLLVVLVVCLWHLAARSEQATLVRTGLAALFVSYAVHIFGLSATQALGWRPGTWAYQAYPGLKEGNELAGWLLVVLALWRLAPPWPGTSKRMGQVKPGAAQAPSPSRPARAPHRS